MPLDLDLSKLRFGTELLKRGFAKMQKGGVVMDVTNAEQALIAENAEAVAVMALERVPADIRAAGGGARMADPSVVSRVMVADPIAGMEECLVGHFVEDAVVQCLGGGYVVERGDPSPVGQDRQRI